MTDTGVFPDPSPGRNTVPWRRVAAVAAAVFLAVAGCSKINTDLEVTASLSGQRTMVVSVSESDFSSHVSGTAEEASAVIASAMPANLTGTPLTLTEGTYETTIVLPFSSPSDYLTKVQEVLDAGEVDLEAEVLMAIADSPFSQGVVVDENFDSEDLLEWMRTALVDEGMISSTDADSMFEFGTTSVTFEGETETTYSTISFDNREKGGMSSVSMTTDYQGEGTWSRTINFEMDGDVYEEQASLVESYFSENLPAGATMSAIDDSGYYVLWSVDIPASSPADMETAMNELFGTDQSVFRVEEGAPALGIPATVVTLTDAVDCSQLCYYTDSPIEDQITLPDSWSLNESESGAGYVEPDGDHQVLFTPANGKPIEFIEYLPLEEIDVELSVALSGALDLEITYEVEAEIASANTELLKSVFQAGPADDVEVKENSETWEYVVKVKAPSAAEFSVLLTTYIPGAEVVFTQTGGAFSEEYFGAIGIPFSTVIGDAEVLEGIDYKVSLPFLHSLKTEKALQTECFADASIFPGADTDPWCALATGGRAVIDSGDTVGERDSVLVFAGSGLSLFSMILIASLLGVFIIAGVVLFLLRGKIAAKRAALKEKKALAQATLPSADVFVAEAYTGEMGDETVVSVTELAPPAGPTAVTEEYPEFPIAAPQEPEPRSDDELY